MSSNQPRSRKSPPLNSFLSASSRTDMTQRFFDEDLWQSPPCTEVEVDVATFLEGTIRPIWETEPISIYALTNSARPVAQVLVGVIAGVLGFNRGLKATHGPKEIADKLSDVRDAAMRLGSLAQGNDGERPIEKQPSWIYDWRSRSPISTVDMLASDYSINLHPLLQSLLNLAHDVSPSDQIDGPIFEAALKRANAINQSIVEFFEQVPIIVEQLTSAEEYCRKMVRPYEVEKTKGAPTDRGKDWALTRLLWIWRDAIGQEPTIYLRRTRDGVELEVPEPTGCMAFVVDALSKIEPLKPHQLSGLERKLMDLRPRIPDTPLLKQRSRGN
jgi:hypothetical protein